MEIRDIKGDIKFTTPIYKGSIRRVNLMQEDYILLKFSAENVVNFNIGDSIPNGFELTESFKPTLNSKTNGYDYELRFDRYYYKWKNKKFFYAPDFGGREASWSLNADISTHLGVFLRNLKALGYKYNGLDFEFAVSEIVGNESKFIQYENIDLISSLTRIAEEWSCEWWVTDNVINFGKCEYGTPIDFTIGESVSLMPKSGANSATPTRIYAFGSERNVPENYRPIEDSITVNGIVQKRLMLPEGVPYIDVYPNLSNEEAIEEIKIFDSVYPKRINKTSKVSREERKVKNENTEKLETQIIYGVKDDTLRFKQEYILPRQELRVTFQSGLLNGRDYGVEFKDDYFLIKEENNVPNDILYPQKGDEFVLYGYDTKFVDIQLLPEAEIELQEEAEKYVQELREDPTTYECKMMASYMFNEGNVKTFDLGDRVQLTNKALFDEPRVSRIMGYEYPLDKPYDNPVYYVGRKATYSRLNRIESKLDTLEYKEKLFSSTNVGVYIITQHDITTPTDRNVFSSKKSLQTFMRKDISDSTDYLLKFLDGIEIGDKYAITKDGKAVLSAIESLNADVKDLVAIKAKTTNLEAIEADIKKATINDLVAELAKIYNLSVTDTANILRAVVGSISSDTFKSGFAGEGFRIYEALNGDWNLEIDNLIVRKVFQVFELLIQEIKHQGGVQLYSPAGGKITKVTDIGQAWRCEVEGSSSFATNDLVICQQFGSPSKRYWRLATGSGDGWVNLSKTDCETGSANPQIGDEIATLGNKTNIARQSAYLISVVGSNAPYTAYYSGINSYSLVGKEPTRIGNLDGIVDSDFGALKGNGLYSENAYLKGIFRLTNGKRIETVLDENKQEADNKIESTKSELSASISKAEQAALSAQKAIDGLQIGGVNLIPDSLKPVFYNNGVEQQIIQRHIGNGVRMTLYRGTQASIYTGYFIKDKWKQPYLITCTITTYDSGITLFQGWTRLDNNERYIPANTTVIAVFRGVFDSDNARVIGFYAQFESEKIGDYFDLTYYMLELGNKPTDWSPAPEDFQSEIKKQITDVRTDFQITEGQINGKLQETTQILTESKALSGETKQTLEATTARINEFDITAKKFEGTLGEITKKQGEVEGSILNVQATANSLQASVTGFKETEREIKDTATRIEASHEGIVLEASEKSAQKAIDGLEIGVANHVRNFNYWDYVGFKRTLYEDGKIIKLIKTDDYDRAIGSNIIKRIGEYSFAINVENPSNTQTVQIYFGFRGNIISFSHNQYVLNNGTEYVLPPLFKDRLYFTICYKTSVNANLYIGMSSKSESKEVIFSYPKLEKGNKSTDWTPAPEDIDAQFTETNTSLKVLNNQIASEVSKTNGIRTDLTQVQQSHNSFKIQVKTDISGAIDSNNEVIRSSFEMKDNKISLLGAQIDITGKVTFRALDTTTQSQINTAGSTASTALSNAGTAQSSANTANTNANKAIADAGKAQASANSANSSISSLKGSLGSLAYEDKVELAKLGTTVIEGGFIKTDLIQANSIKAEKLDIKSLEAVRIKTSNLEVLSGAKIGDYTIDNRGLSYGLVEKWGDSDYKLDMTHLVPGEIRIQKQHGYFTAGDLSLVKVGLGDNADPELFGSNPVAGQNQRYGYTAGYFYRKMKVSFDDMYYPAVQILSDNIMERNVALYTKGTHFAQESMINNARFIHTKYLNVLDISYGGIFVVNASVDSNLYFPQKSDIEVFMRQYKLTELAYPIEIICDDYNDHAIFVGFQEGDSVKHILNNNAGLLAKSYKMQKGDYLKVLLIYRNKDYYAQLMSSSS